MRGADGWLGNRKFLNRGLGVSSELMSRLRIAKAKSRATPTAPAELTGASAVPMIDDTRPSVGSAHQTDATTGSASMEDANPEHLFSHADRRFQRSNTVSTQVPPAGSVARALQTPASTGTVASMVSHGSSVGADWSVTPMGGDPLRFQAVDPMAASPAARVALFRKHAQLARARRRLPWHPYTHNGRHPRRKRGTKKKAESSSRHRSVRKRGRHDDDTNSRSRLHRQPEERFPGSV